MTNEQLTLLAAGIAATSSLVAVVVNVRSTGTSELRKWRREEERALIARILVKMSEALKLWERLAIELDSAQGAPDVYLQVARPAIANVRTAVAPVDAELTMALAEVELIAGAKVVGLVKAIERQFEGLRHLLRPASGSDDQYRAFFRYELNLDRLRVELTDAVRRELRIDRAPSTRRRVRRWRHNVRLRFMSLAARLSDRRRAKRDRTPSSRQGHTGGTRDD